MLCSSGWSQHVQNFFWQVALQKGWRQPDLHIPEELLHIISACLVVMATTNVVFYSLWSAA